MQKYKSIQFLLEAELFQAKTSNQGSSARNNQNYKGMQQNSCNIKIVTYFENQQCFGGNLHNKLELNQLCASENIKEQKNSLRGGGCGSSKVADPRILNKNEKSQSYPENFFVSQEKYLKVIVEKAKLGKDETQREEILKAIQWFNSYKEYFNNLNSESQASYDIIMTFLPILLQSAIVYLRISGTLCIQVLQICNELARVLFSYFMINNSRFLKKEDKQSLLDIISEFEIQLNIETGVWVAGVEFEITMIKAVILNTPSNSSEGTKLLMSFCSGLVKTVLTLSPSEQFLDSLVQGAIFLHKAYKTRDLLKKYEIYYYFEQLKWYIIQVLKFGSSSAYKMIQIVGSAYYQYIENTTDWLIKFCWIKMISNLIQYRPLLLKSELNDNWNYLITNKLITPLQRDSGLLQLQKLQNEHFQMLGKYFQNLKQLKVFQETLLTSLKSNNNNYFVLQIQTNKEQLQQDYLSLFLSQEKDFHYVQDFNKSIEEFNSAVQLFKKQYKSNLENLSNIDQQLLIDDIKSNVQELISNNFKLFNVFEKILCYLQFQFFQYRLIIISTDDRGFEQKNLFLSEIEILENQFKEDISVFKDKNLQDKQNVVMPLIYLQQLFLKQVQKNLNQDCEQWFNQLFQSVEVFQTFLKIIDSNTQRFMNLKIKQFGEYQKNKKSSQMNFITKDPYLIMESMILNLKGLINQDIVKEAIDLISKEEQEFKLDRFKYYYFLEQLLKNQNNQIDSLRVFLSQFIIFIEKNSHLLELKQSGNPNEKTLQLEKQFQLIQNIFSDQFISEKQNMIDQLLNQLRNDKKYFLEQAKKTQDQKGIILDLTLVEEIFEQIKEDPQNLIIFKTQILTIYERYNLQKIDNLTPIDNTSEILCLLSHINQEFENEIEYHKGILKTIRQIIRLYQKILSINHEFDLESVGFDSVKSLLNQLEKQLLQSFDNYSNSLNQPRVNLNNLQSLESDLKCILPFLHEIDNFYQKDLFQTEKKNENNTLDNAILLVQDFAEDFIYKVKQCYVVSLLEISAFSYAQNQQIFCQENIMMVWVFEKDERVKAILKNKEIIETQRKLFSCDLKSFTNRLHSQMNQRFDKINDLEMKISQEADLKIRSKLQLQLQEICKEFEEFVESINEMSEKLDLTIAFLKEIKKDLTKIKAKLENIETAIYAIGEDLKNLRGKNFHELLNLRKTKILNQSRIQEIYIPLKFYGEKNKLMDQVNEFLNLKHYDVLLIKGIAGSGKSKAVRKIEEFIWETENWIPIYAQLSTIKDPRFNLLEQILQSESYEFDKTQIREFKESLRDFKFKLLLILDSYEEMSQEFEKTNLYQTNRFLIQYFCENEALSKGKEWFKVIITTRTEFLTQVNYQTWFYGETLATLKELELDGFDIEQQQEYLEKYTYQNIKAQLYEIYESGKQSDAEQNIEEFKVFWIKVEHYINNSQISLLTQQTEFALNEQQIKQILYFIKQEHCFKNIKNEQIIRLNKALSQQWSKYKFQSLINDFNIQSIINTPFMMEIVLKVLPNMIEKLQDPTEQKQNFIENFVSLYNKSHKFEISDLTMKANKIWGDLEGKNLFQSLKLNNIEDADIIIAAMQNKTLVPFDFYQSFIEYYHQKQIFRQMQLGKVKNFTGLLQDLFDFSQSLALDMTINKLTSVRYSQQSQLKLRHIKQNILNEEWKEIYFDDSEYKQLIRSCILLNQQGNIYYFTHKSIQEFFVSYYLFEFFRKADNVESELYNKNEFNISEEHFRGTLNLFKQKMKLIKNLKSSLIHLVKLSKNSPQFIRAASNSMYLLSFNDETLNYQDFNDIKINNTKLNGLSFYASSLQNSCFQNVNISMCNFNSSNIKNSNWKQIQCNELPSLFGHSDSVTQIAFYKNGNVLVSSSYDETVRMWDFKSGIEIQQFKWHKGQINKFCISKDGKLLASGGYDQQIIIWDLEKNQLVNSITFEGQPIFSLDFSSDSEHLAVGSNEPQIQVYSMKTFQLINSLKGHQSSVKAIAYSSDNLASGSEDKRILLWDKEYEQIKVFEGHTGTVYSIAFSLDQQILASGSYDESVRLWNIKAGTQLFLLEGHSGSVDCLAFSPTENILASGSFDETIRLWDIKAGKLITLYEGHSSCVKSLAFSPDGLTLVSGGGDKILRLWNVEGCFQISLLDGHTGNVNSLAFSSDGLYLASCSFDETIKLWDAQDGKFVTQFKGHTGSIYSVVFSPNNQILASSSYDDSIRLWHIRQVKQIAILQGHQSLIKQICFSLNGQNLASASFDQTIIIWNVETFQQVIVLKGHESFVNSVTYIADSHILASGSNDETIRLWDTITGEQVNIFEQNSGLINCVTSHGSILAAGCADKTIRLIDLTEQKQISILKGHYSGIYSVAFNPQGSIVASGGQDRNIRLWLLSTLKCIAILEGHKDIINAVQFSKVNQNILASSSDDKTIRLWDIQNIDSQQTNDINMKQKLCYKIIAKGKAISADHCQISGSQLSTQSGWNLQSLLIQKGAMI